MWNIYVLQGVKGGLYKGCVEDLNAELEKHRQGLMENSKDQLPLDLIFTAAFPDKNKARDFERYLRSGSGRSFLKRHVV
ncbi:MAG TPA: hypothetical protein PKM91_03860 [Cyclobacteriaceae bacterium]|jgi:predicted GIY-YIG superfamily endonuclease|nr:endonuclease [Cytophagales bacterium]HNP76346.1 hypothetical protein [Cyclobacteriaceae bacterium]HQQ84115.1 hypothetical protein [Cyclobacteriaceae bacterium]